jgi:hypothetical protein
VDATEIILKRVKWLQAVLAEDGPLEKFGAEKFKKGPEFVLPMTLMPGEGGHSTSKENSGSLERPRSRLPRLELFWTTPFEGSLGEKSTEAFVSGRRKNEGLESDIGCSEELLID